MGHLDSDPSNFYRICWGTSTESPTLWNSSGTPYRSSYNIHEMFFAQAVNERGSDVPGMILGLTLPT